MCFILSNVAHADCQGEFTPVAGSGSPFSQVHYFPKNGNKIIIAGKQQTIPPGVGVISGGVIGTYNKASIDKVPNKILLPHTTYYVYVYMSNGVMTMDFSKTGHKEDNTYGNEVHATDPSRSLVGMVHTNAKSLFVGSNKSQMTLSWCNRGSTGLIEGLDGDHTDSITAFVEPNPEHRLEWLQWGINNSFRQGFTVPNIHVTATVVNSKPGAYVEVTIGIDNAKQSTFIIGTQCSSTNAASVVSVTMVGANGSNEGYHYATFLMRAPQGGTATVKSGDIFSDPLQS